MTRVQELIAKYQITRMPDNKIKCYGSKPTRKEIEELTAAKDEILAELDRREAAAIARKEAEERRLEEERQAIMNGKAPITLCFKDGEYLQGYAVYGVAAELLETLGLAKYVDGWGYIVEDAVVKALGKSFTYAQAAEYANPTLEAKAAEEARQEAIVTAALKEAKETGAPVELGRWTEPCIDSDEECNYDLCLRYAMPNGSINIERIHRY